MQYNPDKDVYDILKVDSDACADEVKQTYRKLSFQYHPDHNPGDKNAEEKFKEISEVYSLFEKHLRDPFTRVKYNQERAQFKINQQTGSWSYQQSSSTGTTPRGYQSYAQGSYTPSPFPIPLASIVVFDIVLLALIILNVDPRVNIAFSTSNVSLLCYSLSTQTIGIQTGRILKAASYLFVIIGATLFHFK